MRYPQFSGIRFSVLCIYLLDATHYATPTTNLDYKSREPKELSEHHYSKVGRKQAVDKMVTIKVCLGRDF